MFIKFQGKLVKVLPQESGTSQRGNEWKKDSYLFETIENDAKYIKKVVLESINKTFPLDEGETYTMGIEPESREFNGKWYTSIRLVGLLDDAGKIVKDVATESVAQAPTQQPAPAQESTELPF